MSNQNAAKSGWEFFENLKKEAPDDYVRKEIDQVHKDYITVFASPAGQRVLADLNKRFVDIKLFPGYYPDGINTGINVAINAALHDWVLMLKTMTNPGVKNDKKERQVNNKPSK